MKAINDYDAAGSPLRWYGGKAKQAKVLASLLPPHRTYVEGFGGGAQLLFTKRPSEREVLNDIDADLMHFWRSVKHPDIVPSLISQLHLTPNSREEYEWCNGTYDLNVDPVERARQFFVLSKQSFNGAFRKGWSYSTCSSYGSAFPNGVARLNAAHRRLQDVTLENLHFREVIEWYDHSETLFFMDPPYYHKTRASKARYQHEMTDADHMELLGILLEAKGMIVLSGYAHPLYDDTLSQWERHEIIQPRNAANGSSAIIAFTVEHAGPWPYRALFAEKCLLRLP